MDRRSFERDFGGVSARVSAGASPQRMPAAMHDAGAPEVSVLIVAYNSRAFILDCVRSVVEHTITPHEILLIDNAEDGSGELVAAELPWVRVISNRANLGFGRGNNRLAAFAKAPRLLLLNPDTYLRDDAIDRLVAFARTKPEAGAWGGMTVTPQGELDAGNRLVIPTLGRFLRSALGDAAAFEEGGLPAGAREPGRVDVLPGGFMMVRREAWDVLGGFDESFFLYSEEIDLFLRLKRAGYEAWATPDAVVVHDAGSGERASPRRLLFRTKGQMHFARKHWGWAAAQGAGALLWAGFAWRWLAGAALSFAVRDRAGRWRSMRESYAGLVWRPWRWWRGYA